MVTWDETKRAENLAKQGLDFFGVEAVFDGPLVSWRERHWSAGVSPASCFFFAGGTPALHYFAALRAGGNDTLSRPCRATLPRQAGEGKAGDVTGGKFHGTFHEQVFYKKM
jgi:hypothetical protein